MEHSSHTDIGDRRQSGVDMGDQMGSLVVAGLREMNPVADPVGTCFVPAPCICVIRRFESLCRRQQLRTRQPGGFAINFFEVMRPCQTEGVDRGQSAHRQALFVAVQSGQKLEPVSTYLFSVSLPCCLPFGQARVFDSVAVAGEPFKCSHLLNPFRELCGELIQRGPHRFPDQFSAVEQANGRQNMGRVAALLAMRFDQPLLPEALQHGVHEQCFCVPIDQPTSEFAEYGEVEAGVRQFQVQQVLEINTGTNLVGHPAISQVLCELYEGHESELTGGKRGLSPTRVELNEVLVGEERTELIPKSQVWIPFAKGSASDTSRFGGNLTDRFWL